MKITEDSSPHFSPRKEGKEIKYLILHYTGTRTAEEALHLLKGGREGHEVSAHYFVDEDGAITRLVDESMRAWHAGKSGWEGEDDINSCSIGIEIQNPGHDYGYTPFPEEQMKAVTGLCKEIIARYNIMPCHVLAHSDVAPERKKDPGELFPWAELAKQGIGIWPEVTDTPPTEEVKSILTQYGYDQRVDTKTLVTAFQRHFEPEAFLIDGKAGVASPDTVKKVQALLKQKKSLWPRNS